MRVVKRDLFLELIHGAFQRFDCYFSEFNVAAGFIACAVALVIFEIRKVQLTDYLSALAVAPLIAWLLG